MKQRMTATIAALFWMSQGLALGGEPRQLQMKWSELDSIIAGRKVALVLPSGTHIRGKVLKVEPEGLRLNIAKTSDRKAQPKGEHLIPRQSVSVLRYTEYRKIGRLIGTLALPAAVAAGALAATPSYLEGGAIAVAAGAGTGCVVGAVIGGYYIGKRVDKKVTEIRVARGE